MTDTKHTPGPWTCEVWGKRSENYKDIWGIFANADPDHKMPAECHGPKAEANARLITAAPDLLEAIRALATIAEYYHKGEAPGHEDACEIPDNCGHCLAMRKVNTAIAKATGKE